MVEYKWKLREINKHAAQCTSCVVTHLVMWADLTVVLWASVAMEELLYTCWQKAEVERSLPGRSGSAGSPTAAFSQTVRDDDC